jgi:hypothetical protein
MNRAQLVFGFLVLCLPIIVAGADLSVAAAIALVVLALLLRWFITLNTIMAPAKGPELELSSISASHFVEKVRWCLDRLGVNYSERPAGGTLGAFFAGRTVPVLRFRTGLVYSSIGNSPEILRYLWGRYFAQEPQATAFLQPDTERIELEKRLDRYGVDLQVWVYFHLLDDRALALHAWGCNNPAIPAYQRMLLRPLFPLLRFLVRRSGFRRSTMPGPWRTSRTCWPRWKPGWRTDGIHCWAGNRSISPTSLSPPCPGSGCNRPVMAGAKPTR